jgi:hypothetical protein
VQARNKDNAGEVVVSYLASGDPIARTPLLAISGEVFGLDSLRTVSRVFLFPLLGIVAILMVFKPADIDRTALIGFAWGVVACAAYDLFRLPSVYVFHLWGDFFGRIGGWATGTHSNYLAGYLWRYFGDGAGIGVVVFIHAAVIGVASWSRRRVMGFTVAFAVFPVWTGLVLTDALAPTGRALFPLTATTLILSLVGHLIFGAMLGYGLSVSLPRAPHRAPAPRMAPRARVDEPAPSRLRPARHTA